MTPERKAQQWDHLIESRLISLESRAYGIIMEHLRSLGLFTSDETDKIAHDLAKDLTVSCKKRIEKLK